MKDAKWIKEENDKMKIEQIKHSCLLWKQHSKVLKSTPIPEQINLIVIFFKSMSLSLDFKRDMICGLRVRVYHFSVLKR